MFAVAALLWYSQYGAFIKTQLVGMDTSMGTTTSGDNTVIVGTTSVGVYECITDYCQCADVECNDNELCTVTFNPTTNVNIGRCMPLPDVLPPDTVQVVGEIPFEGAVGIDIPNDVPGGAALGQCPSNPSMWCLVWNPGFLFPGGEFPLGCPYVSGNFVQDCMPNLPPGDPIGDMVTEIDAWFDLNPDIVPATETDPNVQIVPDPYVVTQPNSPLIPNIDPQTCVEVTTVAGTCAAIAETCAGTVQAVTNAAGCFLGCICGPFFDPNAGT